ncbi:hypothetical protein NBRGN_104_00710 [Nocardia brasiliensis NBRC 14402]|uniref:hypothetical protein n=1 Tax=Nocardia brasiliensis TaxID=37326 RepID=UPI0002DAD17D|nr:hypothetical protein [Nocardia brasiliensis]ASF07324.1 hypothetical protein CEQ30_08130 [Nocardia brasiliensis]GAJ86103.1 hypothetical protein NBRGN_104_00710 [Nocardia brasiliensis NBRC 14402]SUB47371.1 Uncharacterised protein [Nocardia brasiliensis]
MTTKEADSGHLAGSTNFVDRDAERVCAELHAMRAVGDDTGALPAGHGLADVRRVALVGTNRLRDVLFHKARHGRV